MNDDSSLRSSRVMLTAGIVICSLLAAVSLLNVPPGKMARLLSARPNPKDIVNANRHLSDSYSEFYPNAKPSRKPPVHTVSQHFEVPVDTSPTPEQSPLPVIRHRDVFQQDRIVDVDNVVYPSDPKSIRRLSTSTVVEKNSLDQQESVESNAPAVDQATDVSTQSKVESSTATPATTHITVPVTVNVDNGEILSELMRIQEEVLVTRSRLEDAAMLSQRRSSERPSEVVANREPDSIAAEIPSKSSEPDIAAKTPSFDPPVAPIVPMEKPAKTVMKDTVTATTETSAAASVSQPPAAFPEFAPVESDEFPTVKPEATADVETPAFEDFAEPNSGPADEPMDEELPAFELPSQSSRRQDGPSLNSYADWVQSFDEPDTSNKITQVVYQEEPEVPELPLFDASATPTATEQAPREVAEPLVQTPPAEPVVLAEPSGPSTPVPPVPVKAVADFHEPQTIPVFPVSDSISEPALAPPEFDSAELTIPNTTTGSVPAEKRITQVSGSSKSQQAMPSKSSANTNHKNASKQSPAVSHRPRQIPDKKTNEGLLSRMKSKVSKTVARVPKPDFDTPRWVDRLADWKDERFGKKNSTAPEMANPSEALAANQRTQVTPQYSTQQGFAKSSNSTSQRPAISIPTTSTKPTTVAGSKFRPRANVTTVPRSGSSSSQGQPVQSNSPSVAASRPQAKPPTNMAPKANTQSPKATQSAVANASYRKDSTQPSTGEHAKASFVNSSAAQPNMSQPVVTESMVMIPSTVPQTYRPAPHPNSFSSVVHRQMAHAEASASQHAFGKRSAAPVKRKPLPPSPPGEPTAYIGTLDAFNYRMTMVVRPPNFANMRMTPVSQWFSGGDSAEAEENSAALHRVGSTIRYATQPKTVR